MKSSWEDPDPDVLEALADISWDAALTEVIAPHETPEERMRAGVTAVLRVLLANGIVLAMSRSEWPSFVFMKAPSGTREKIT